MKRRRYLATAAGLAGGSIGGCMGLRGEVALESPTRERVDGRVDFIHDRNDTELLVVSFRHRPDAPTLHRLKAVVHPRDTPITAIRFRFQPDTTRPSTVDVYLRSPADQDIDFEFTRRAQWSVIETTFTDPRTADTDFDVLLFADGAAVDELPPLRVEYDITLSGTGVLANTVTAHNQAVLNPTEET